MADKVKGVGLEAVQLELAFAGEKLTWSRLKKAECEQIAQAFRSRELEVAAVAGYTNLVDPDPEARAKGLAELRELLRRVRDLGSTQAVTESGGVNPRNPWQPDPRNWEEGTWKQLVDTVGELCRLAEEEGCRLLLEPFWAHVVRDGEWAQRLCAEVNSPALGLVADPANLITLENASRWEEVMADFFARVGSRVTLAHAKDAQPGPNGVALLGAGKGILDYPRYLRTLRECGYAGALILEHINERAIPETRDFVRGVLERL